MPFYTLTPNIPGDLGENAVLDTSVHPPRVERLHIAIDNWFGEDVIKLFPVHLVTEPLAAAMVESGLRAFELRDAQVTIEPEALELVAQLNLDGVPDFRWFDVTGTAGQDHIGLSGKARLVVSEQALQVFQRFSLEGCDVEEYDPAKHG
ncbi:hypothetical protein D5S17_14610 [Pseudonocardiaceae bacterium YIM PH 21723]|nr:hypothetical protein D5S17_14610 [Pseudonocardiaceae bacterium YIM PH 21723]